MNKSETVFRITKEDDFKSLVENELSRNAGFNKFSFIIDEKGLPKRCVMPEGFYNNKPGDYIPMDPLIDHSKGLTESEVEF